MATIYDMCKRWADGIESGEGAPYKRYVGCNVYVDGRTIYSYGSHFPMGYILAPGLVWLNGDTVSVSTNRHQSKLRDAVQRAGATAIIVPNSALESAGVDYKTIKPVDVQAERYEHTLHTSMNAPADMVTDVYQHVPEHSYASKWYACDESAGCERCAGKSYASYHDTPRVTVTPAHDALWHMSYGDIWGIEDDGSVVGYVNTEGGRQAVKRDGVTGEYRWHTSRHWLGDSVFTAVRRDTRRHVPIDNLEPDRRVYFISSFDRQESRPLYFLSQLPHAVDTVDAAVEALAPESVKTARDMGRHVVRQGDMFAIPMNITKRQLRAMGATFASKSTPDVYRHRAVYEQHDSVAFSLRWLIAEAKESSCVCGGPGSATYPYHAPECKVGRLRALQDDLQAYLSYGFEGKGNGWPLGKAVTRREYGDWRDGKSPYRVAFDASDTQLELWKQPRPDMRDGDTWTRWEDELLSTGGRVSIMGTAHTATEIATLPDGRQFARGMLYHDPSLIGQSWRRPDHRRQHLGKQWHLIARNTVPVSGIGNGRRVA